MILRELQDVLGRERRKKERTETMQKFALGMGFMTILGVATGILFAPKSGKETRKDLKEKATSTAEIIKDTVQEKIETVKDSMAQATKETSDAIKDVQAKAKDVQKAVKKV